MKRKMKKHYLVLAIVILTCLRGQAQKLEWKWSEKLATTGTMKFVGKAADQFFFTMEPGKKEKHLLGFSGDMQLLIDQPLVVRPEHSSAVYLQTLATSDHLVHFHTLQNKKEGKTGLLLTRVALDGATIISDTVLTGMNRSYLGVVFSRYSPDRSKLLVYSFQYLPNKGRFDYQYFVFATINAALIYSGQSSYLSTGGSLAVDNNGILCFDAEWPYREDGKKFGRAKVGHRAHLSLGDSIRREHLLVYDDKYLPGIDFVSGSEKELFLAGFRYADNSKTSRMAANELFLFQVNPATGNITDSAFVDIEGLYPDRRLKIEERVPYTIRAIYRRNGAGWAVVIEQYQLTVGQYGGSAKFNDLAVVYLKPDFSVESMFRIPKRQTNVDNPSIISTFINDRLYILYNDLKENLDAAEEQIRLPGNNDAKNALFLVVVDPAGQMKKSIIAEYDQGKPVSRILDIVLINDRYFVLPAKDRAGILTLQP
jgi:hypothetical protein